MQEIDKNSVVVVYVEIGNLPTQKANDRMEKIRNEMQSQFSPAKVVVLPSSCKIEVFRKDDNVATNTKNIAYNQEYDNVGYHDDQLKEDEPIFKPVDLGEPPLRVDNSFLDEFAGEPIVTTHSIAENFSEWETQQQEFELIVSGMGFPTEIIYDIADCIHDDLKFMNAEIAMVNGETILAKTYEYHDNIISLSVILQEFEYIYSITKEPTQSGNLGTILVIKGIKKILV